MKPEEIRVQISSLNDELKDTLKEVNNRHGERDLLLKQIDTLIEERHQEEGTLQKIKDSFLGVKLSNEKEINLSNEVIKEKQVEIEALTQRISNLSNKESQLMEKIKELKEDKKKLQVIKEELNEAEKNKPLVESVKKELLETIDKFNETKVDLDVAVRERERTQNTSKAERVEHQNWVAETKAKINERYENCKILRLDWESKHKDLRIIRARLKKLWPKDKPFPKLDW